MVENLNKLTFSGYGRVLRDSLPNRGFPSGAQWQESVQYFSAEGLCFYRQSAGPVYLDFELGMTVLAVRREGETAYFYLDKPVCLPAGREFAEALLTEDKTVLLAALDTLREALRELEFTHNNLRESNLRWHRGRIIPIRYYDARIGAAENGGADAEAFEALKRRIAEAPMPRQSVNDVEAVYNPVRKLTGHRWTSHVFEGLVCVEDEGGFGFVDTDNNPVIPSQFLWAGDFHEGRAEVQTRTGMGLIDREGGYVIPPEYEIVDYDPAVSIVHVRHGGRWALFDYLGRRLTEFGREDMQEPVRQEPCRSEICR